jgi:putative phage-type endonuclease
MYLLPKEARHAIIHRMKATIKTHGDAALKMHPHVFDLLCLDQITQRTQAWDTQRRFMLTASDVASAVGLNPYCSRQELLQRKLVGGNIQFSSFGRAAVSHGEKYEDEAAREYFLRYPENGLLYNFGLMTHPEYPYLGGSPDRITSTGILLEIKVSCYATYSRLFVCLFVYWLHGFTSRAKDDAS